MAWEGVRVLGEHAMNNEPASLKQMEFTSITIHNCAYIVIGGCGVHSPNLCVLNLCCRLSIRS